MVMTFSNANYYLGQAVQCVYGVINMKEGNNHQVSKLHLEVNNRPCRIYLSSKNAEWYREPANYKVQAYNAHGTSVVS